MGLESNLYITFFDNSFNKHSFKIKNKSIYIDLNQIDSLDEQLSFKRVKKFFFTNIYILIPLLSFIFFSSNKWLPKFANPRKYAIS